MPLINRAPINIKSDDDHFEALVERQEKAGKKCNMFRKYNAIQIMSTIAVQ